MNDKANNMDKTELVFGGKVPGTNVKIVLLKRGDRYAAYYPKSKKPVKSGKGAVVGTDPVLVVNHASKIVQSWVEKKLKSNEAQAA